MIRDVDYNERIPNNVGLATDPRVKRALEKWHPDTWTGGWTWARGLPDG